MHILSAARNAIELEHIPSSFLVDQNRLFVNVSSETASPFATAAAKAFFEMEPQRGAVRAAVAPQGPPPAMFREKKTGLLRMVYREAVLRFKPKTPERIRKSIIEKHRFRLRKVNSFIPDQVVVYNPESKRIGPEMLDVTNDWATMEEIVFATPNFVSQYRRGTAATIRKEQWHLRNTARYAGQKQGEDVDAREAWKVTRGKRRIVVAVVDDGVDVDHPNLRPNIRRNPDPNEPRDLLGRDFFVPEDNPQHFDPRPKRFHFPFDQMTGNDIHGTCCAGVVAAAGRNNGALGIAPNCRILAVKVFHADDLASDARVADAIRYAALHADILSCSWSGGNSPDVELAIQDAAVGRNGRGSAIFCAAGNENGDPVGFPASHPDAIAIGASTDQAKLASYSNVGPEIWVVAPSSGGVQDIFTTDVSLPGRGFNIGKAEAGGADGLHTNEFGGTSSATPLAAGVAALVLSVNPKLDRVALREVLAKTAEKIGSGYGANGHSNKFGFGRVNAAQAVESDL